MTLFNNTKEAQDYFINGMWITVHPNETKTFNMSQKVLYEVCETCPNWPEITQPDVCNKCGKIKLINGGGDGIPFYGTIAWKPETKFGIFPQQQTDKENA